MPRRPRPRSAIKPGLIAGWPDGVPSPNEVAARVRYRGNAFHETYRFQGLDGRLRSDKTRCDRFTDDQVPVLEEALRAAIRARCVAEPFERGFPSRVWARINGVVHEARHGGARDGDYHGFPIEHEEHQPRDPDGRLAGLEDVFVLPH